MKANRQDRELAKHKDRRAKEAACYHYPFDLLTILDAVAGEKPPRRERKKKCQRTN
jgi:hypothetical protein